MRNLVYESEYNRGARDMALAIIQHLKKNGGRILEQTPKKNMLQFLSLLETWVGRGFNASELCRYGNNGLSFEIESKNGNYTGIKLEKNGD